MLGIIRNVRSIETVPIPGKAEYIPNILLIIAECLEYSGIMTSSAQDSLGFPVPSRDSHEVDSMATKANVFTFNSCFILAVIRQHRHDRK